MWCFMVGVYLALLLSGATVGATALASEFPLEERALVEATAEFFDAVEATSAKGRASSYADPFAATAATDEGRETRISQARTAAPLTGLTGYRITWYPVDTLLGAVDFVGRDETGRNLVCGYILWEFSGDAEPRLRDYDATYVDTWALAALSPEEQGKRLIEANCAFNDVESNFALSNS
jgi:hypothetical protein